MKKIVIIIAWLITYISSDVSAQYANLQVKEACDNGKKWSMENFTSGSLTTPDLPGDEPERLQAHKAWAEAMQSDLVLYRTTKDKAYLIKAINNGLDLMSRRYDYLTYAQTDHKTWSDLDGEKLGYWYDGFVCAAIAELAYIMIQHPDYSGELINQSLPAQLITNHLPAQYSPYVPTPLTTYGDIGEWFRDRVNETMVYYWTNYWADDAGFLYGNKTSTTSTTVCKSETFHKGLQGLNQHSPFTVAAMYLKAIDPNATMGSIPDKIAAFYMTDVFVFEDGDKCDPNNLITNNNECQPLSIMHLNTTYNAYWWFHFGWSRNAYNDHPQCINASDGGGRCRRSCGSITEYIEDISHAALAMEFPIHSIPFLGQYFNATEMVRWKNTFTKLIYDPSYSIYGKGFHNNVIGTDDGMSSEPCGYCVTLPTCNGAFNCLCYREVPLLFAPLYKFDNSDGPNVYDIVMDYYQSTVEPAVIGKDGCWLNERVFLGLSRTVAAQWDKECPNLTLYNRDVVYDQDFFAKGELRIAPNQDSDPFYTATSFAEPQISTQTFTVEDGVEANFSSGSRIVVKKGHIKAGAKSRGYIDPSLYVCSSNRLANPNDGAPGENKEFNEQLAKTENPKPQTSNQTPNHTKTTPTANNQLPITNNQLQIHPNPSQSGIFEVQGLSNTERNQSDSYRITVTNVLGETILQQAPTENPQPETIINLSTQPKGIYFVKIQSGGEFSVHKVVYQ